MSLKTIRKSSRDQDGFTLMVVLLALVVMTMLAIAGLVTAGDEQKASSALRESSTAFYVAEAGLNRVFANWSNHEAAIDSLAAGDSLDLGWQALSTGDSYRAVVHRWDKGDHSMYELVVEGRSHGPQGGKRTLSYALTAGGDGMGTGYMLGECCDAAIIMKGTYGMKPRDGGVVWHSGFDTHPPGWDSAGVCADTLVDRPGLIMQDTSVIEIKADSISTGVIEGDPPIIQDPTINDSIFEYFGDYTWQDIKDQADIVIDGNGNIMMADGSNSINFDSSLPGQKLTAEDIYPRHTIDMSTGELVCDTSHPMNWGSDDPNDPCFDYFPVILAGGEIDFVGGDSYGRFYGQGIIIADWDEVARTGAEIEFEVEVEWRGLTLGRGCIELQKGAQYYGSIFLNATYDGVTCDKSWDMYTDCYAATSCATGETRMQWSQCAVDRAMYNSGLFEHAEATVSSGSGAARRLGQRSFAEMF